ARTVGTIGSESIVYIPEYFRVRDHEDAIKFMRANPFAILISSTEAGPFATHLPIFVRANEGGEKIVLRGHVAKANPHWRYLEQQPQCLTIFHGPHSYISPSNYTLRESVPTWNYGAVHLYGKAQVFSSAEALQGILHELIQTFEPAYASQWASLDEAYRERMLRQIVGFEIEVTKMEAKFKLGQNRTREDQQNMIASLEKADDTAVSGLARLMKAQQPGRVVNGKDNK
ncbi:MAG: FMN-binding negative transcriptional regulator, partial [Candidatus Sulfotelmatobacter sp.]